MPAPAIPRRAAPPRRKQAPPPPPPEPESELAPTEPAAVELLASASDAPASEVTETDKDAIPAVATVVPLLEKDEAVPAEAEEGESILEAATPPSASTSPILSLAAQTEDYSPHDTAIKVEPPTPYTSTFANTQTTADKQEEAEIGDELDRQEPEDEYEEAPEDRRKRIAEKLKEMGAVNPLAGRLGQPAQPETAAAENDAKMDAGAQRAVGTDQNNQYAHGHHEEDGSEVDYPGGSVASPTSPTRTASVHPVLTSIPPPPPRPPVEVENEYEGKDHHKASGEFAEEEGNASSAVDVDGKDEYKRGVQVLLASRQWAEDGGDQGEGKHLSPSFRLDGQSDGVL